LISPPFFNKLITCKTGFSAYHAIKGAWGENQTKCSVKSFCGAKQSQKGFLARNEAKNPPFDR